MNKRHAHALLRLIAELYEVISAPDPPEAQGAPMPMAANQAPSTNGQQAAPANPANPANPITVD